MPDSQEIVDVSFRLRGSELPLDHGYPLYSAISGELPEVHEKERWGIHPVFGEKVGRGTLKLVDESTLKFRLPAEDIPEAIRLAGSTLNVNENKVRVGVPRVYALDTCPSLKSRYVTIKGAIEPEDFQESVHNQLSKLISEPDEVVIKVGPRRVMEIDGYTIIGYQLSLKDLPPEDSLTIQKSGIGGRRKMGGGIFRPGEGGE